MIYCNANVPFIFSGMLRFLSRVAFISNLFLIPVLLIHHVPSFRQWDAGLISHIVITAYFIALPINVLVNVWLLITKLTNKKTGIPLWLQVANALFLLLQLYYFQFT
jgi:hypothetical protein